MPRILIIGSSHANRMLKVMRVLSEFSQYTLIDLTRPGACYKDLKWPDLIEQDDIILFQSFGNDITKKNIKITYSPLGEKIIHLTKFEPIKSETIEKMFFDFKKRISAITNTILVVSLIPRHMRCCTDHNTADRKGLASYQKRVNKLLKTTVTSLPNVHFVEVQKFLNIRAKYLHSDTEFSKYLQDGVHLKTSFYKILLLNIYKRGLLNI